MTLDERFRLLWAPIESDRQDVDGIKHRLAIDDEPDAATILTAIRVMSSTSATIQVMQRL
jgi:hypothetical protein